MSADKVNLSSETHTVLQVGHLSKSFDDLRVLQDISFDVSHGEAVAVIGPSGSGKSTLLRLINQLETVDSGEIVVCGDRLCRDHTDGKAIYASKDVLRRIRLKIGLVFQNFNLFPHFNILRNLTEAPVLVLKQSREEAEESGRQLLAKLGLADKAAAFPWQLSGGQQQRAAIARALALNPEIIFFDEPTSALDPELTGEVLKVIRSLAEEKMTMVVVTHEMAFARSLADRIVFMDQGHIIEQGPPDRIFNSNHERTRQFLQNYVADRG